MIKTKSIQQLNNEVFSSIFSNELNQLFAIFKKYNHELRIAGGAVRDLLMNITPKDIDLATNATPEEMKSMFLNENIRTLNRNGEKHGTVTARINDKENFEITTLRIDVKTDGRHAEVQFTSDWKEDANRRDLTINSIFLDENGIVYDFFGGLEDLNEKQVKFVGEPEQRIREDYLRILRFFRFYGRIANNDSVFNVNAIEAIKNNASGLQNIHGERIWTELRKIVTDNYAESIMKKMIEVNVQTFIGLPENPNINEFSKVYKRNLETNRKYDISPVGMIVSLLYTNEDVDLFAKRVRFSTEERKLAEFLMKFRYCDKNSTDDDKLKIYKIILVDSIKDLKAYERLHELLLYQGNSNYINELDNWKVPIFPLNGDRLVELGLPKGPLFSQVLSDLKEIWKFEFNFDADERTLLNKFDNLKHKYLNK